MVGTPLYIAPEVWNNKPYNRAADMYSAGLIIWEIWYGRYLNLNCAAGNAREVVRQAYVQGTRPVGRWDEMMRQCWSEDPLERPTAKRCAAVYREYM